MNRHSPAGLTIVELIAVIAIIGILFMLLLPGVQSARDGARRMSCSSNLVQLMIAVQNYENAIEAYPPGTIDAQGPIFNVAFGYHHNWIEQILPYLELQNTYHHVDRSVSVYHWNNAPVRLEVPSGPFRCPSSVAPNGGLSEYAAVHHDVESPIDTDNHGVFFLNSRIRRLDVSDGHSNTLFLGEKLPLAGDMGWLSGTRSTLRNTGTRINAVDKTGRINAGRADGAAVNSLGFLPLGDTPPPWLTGETEVDPPIQNSAAILNGLPTTPTAVGGFESNHDGGVNFVLGDGSLRFVRNTIDMRVYQRLGHRADGQLLSEDF